MLAVCKKKKNPEENKQRKRHEYNGPKKDEFPPVISELFFCVSKCYARICRLLHRKAKSSDALRGFSSKTQND